MENFKLKISGLSTKSIFLVAENHTESRPKTTTTVMTTNATTMANNLNSQLVQQISQVLPRSAVTYGYSQD